MDLRDLSGNQNDIAVSITKRLLLDEVKGSNVVFSPLSFHFVLSLIAAGSKGPTLDQLLSFLKSKSKDELHYFASELLSIVLFDCFSSGGPHLSFANSIWVDQSLSLKPSFKQVVDSAYKASISQVDFQTKAADVINEVNLWAEKETNGLIKNILPPNSINNSIVLILANALYFKGFWKEKFDNSSTKNQAFHLFNGTFVQVPFMTSNKKHFIAAFDRFKVLRLPYKQGNNKCSFSMYIYLPDAKDGLSSLIEKAASQSGFFERHIPSEQVYGKFKIPKFKICFGFEASKLMQKLGLDLPFSGEALSDMVESPIGLKVSKMFHKSFIEVNEDGTEAAAATVTVAMFGSSMNLTQNIDFVADHPFLFLIREHMTGMILFIGHVFEPLIS